MAATQTQKEPKNLVHQNAILCETVGKELRNQKLYIRYTMNPHKKSYTLTGKPNSRHDSADGLGDEEFLKIYEKAQQLPTEKLEYPITEAQEIGWDTTPLRDPMRHDVRLYHPKQHSEITKFMDAYWRQKEQEKLQQ